MSSQGAAREGDGVGVHQHQQQGGDGGRGRETAKGQREGMGAQTARKGDRVGRVRLQR